MVFCYAAAAAKSLQLCPTPCDPIEGSPPGSSAHGIFQAGVLEWGAIAFSFEQITEAVKSRYHFRIIIITHTHFPPISPIPPTNRS